MTSPTQNPALNFFQVSQRQRELNHTISQLLDLLGRMPLPFFDSRSSKCVEDDSDRMFGFSWFSENSEALFEVSADRKLCRPPKSRFTNANVTNSGQSKSAQACTIHVEGKQVPEIFDATQVIWLDVAILVTRGSRFLVIEPQLDLFEDGVAELFEEMNICNCSASAPEGDG